MKIAFFVVVVVVGMYHPKKRRKQLQKYGDSIDYNMVKIR